MLFSKIVPNCKKLGLLDAGDGWLREKFTELGVIAFEDWVDTGEGVIAVYQLAEGTLKRRVVHSPPSGPSSQNLRRRDPLDVQPRRGRRCPAGAGGSAGSPLGDLLLLGGGGGGVTPRW